MSVDLRVQKTVHTLTAFCVDLDVRAVVDSPSRYCRVLNRVPAVAVGSKGSNKNCSRGWPLKGLSRGRSSSSCHVKNIVSRPTRNPQLKLEKFPPTGF